MPCCTQTNGLGALGQDISELQAGASAFQDAVVQAKNFWDSLVASLGIGAGRREADIIVPIQNQLANTVLAPVGDFLQRVRSGTLTPSCTQCVTYKAQLEAANTNWLNYLHQTYWQDGRAAQQAEATLAPIIRSQLDELAQCVAAKCGAAGGIGAIFTTPSGETNWPVLAAGAGILFMLLRKP